MCTLSSLARQCEEKALLFLSVSLILAALTPVRTADAEEKPDVSPKIACSALNGKTIEGVQVTSAAEVAATASVAGYCRVDGTKIGTQLDIEVRLPEGWQRRLVQEGGGGFDGFIMPIGKEDVALNLHAVQVVTNGGHRDPTGKDFLNDPAKIQLYAHSSIGEGLKFAKAVIAKYYGSQPSYSYFEGCSNGGRGALNAADKYGAEFDAVIAGAPSRNVPGQIEQWTRAAQLTLPSPTKLGAVYAAEVAKCDDLDGVKDGIISNWMACTFDPAVDVPQSVGLTASEAASVKTLMADLQLSDGSTIYSGYLFGNMAQWGPAYAGLGIGHMKYIVLSDQDWDPRTFTADKYYSGMSQLIDGTYGFDASVSGLAHFLESGKKIVVWQGSDDTLLSLKDTIRTWEPVAKAAGDAARRNSRT